VALRLRPLRLEDEADARKAHAELEEEGFAFLLGWDTQEPWAKYLHKRDDNRRGIGLSPRWVPSTFLGAFCGRDLVGRISIRHKLNDFLLEEGGHVGYCVRPAQRGQGFANEILRQGLVIARAEGIDRVLLTCDDDNLASARIIERHGGILEDIRPGTDGGPPKRRDWID
jgi:predicted acetyltransferase